MPSLPDAPRTADALRDRICQNTKIGLKHHFFNSTNVQIERASPKDLSTGKS